MLSPKLAPRRTRRGHEGRPSVASQESRAGAEDERERRTGTDGALNLGVPIARGRKRGGAMLSTAPVASPAAASLDLPLVIGVSTRALFEVEEENAVFERLGEAAYTDLQRERELKILEPGCAFEFIRRLLALNPAEGPQLVEVVLLSRNAPDLALRAFHSCERHGLAISEGSFTSGRSLAPFLAAWGVDLFLSKDEEDVCAAVEARTAAAILGPVPPALRPEGSDEVCFGLDGDAVTFGAESEAIFREQGLEAFERHERRSARVPLSRGPFGGALLLKLAELRRQRQRSDGTSHVRIVMVTARAAPAHERVVRTLRSWDTLFDEVHFVGHHAKAPFLAASGVQIYFDDSKAHVELASRLVPAGRVPELPSPQRHRDAKAH
jgi:5'-nucleotidase